MQSDKIRVLLVEDDNIDWKTFDRFVKRNQLPYEHARANSVSEAKQVLGSTDFQVVLLDYLLGDGTAFDLFEHVPRHIPFIIVTGSGDEEIAVQAMKAGASDYLIKDPTGGWVKTLPITVNNALRAKSAENALKAFYDKLERMVEERTEELTVTNRTLTREIDQRRQAEAALRQSEERFRTLAETTSELVWETDAKGVFIYVSPKVRELLGYTQEQVVGKSRWDLLPPSEAEEVSAHFHAFLDKGLPFRDLEYHGRTKNGQSIILESSGVPFFDKTGQVRGYRGIERDISDRKKALEMLIQSERRGAYAELASGVAHNFNNLLQVVILGMESAVSSINAGNASEGRESLEKILSSCRFGADTVRRLQYFATKKSDDVPSGGKVFDLTATVEEAVQMSQPWWKSEPERKGLSIRFSTDYAEGCHVLGKENELFELAVNLVKNAAEALPQGGEIFVRTFIQQETAGLEVSDNGVGIPEANLGKLFDPFFTTKGPGGTGMGLASAYGIVKRHGGDIAVESREGEGSKFTVRFPMAKKPAVKPQEAVVELPTPLRALLVDDQLLITEMLKKGLQEQDFIISTASSGEDALAIFTRDQFDVIVSDLGMPGMNGLQLAEHVSEFCRRTLIPKPLFIILSGWSSELTDEETLALAGVEAVLQKPVSVKGLMRVIQDRLKKMTERREVPSR